MMTNDVQSFCGNYYRENRLNMKVVVLENEKEEKLFTEFIKQFEMVNKTDICVPRIKLFLSDCDGCLTDGGMYYSEFGDELKKFNTRDGMAFSLLRQMGILTGIITSENVKLNVRRANKLKLDIFESGCKKKIDNINKICDRYNIGIENVCYVGDDINDLESIKTVGFGCCPSDANQAVKEVADYVTSAKGGEGVIREIVELIRSQRYSDYF